MLFISALTKYLTMHYNVPLVVAIRYIVHCLLMIVLLVPRQGKQLFKTQRTGLVLVRAASLAIASLFLGLALQRMPVAETTALNFLAPMLVILLAYPVLGERIGLFGWVASIMGFGGVLLIVHPSSDLDSMGIFYTLCAVGAGAVYQLLSRVLVKTETTLSLLFYTALIGAVGFGIFLPWFWIKEIPMFLDVLLFLSMGITAGLGHFLFTAAYRYSPASLLAPLNYLQLLWAGLLGWAVFGHVPEPLSFLGMCLIALSGVMIALNSRKPKRLLSLVLAKVSTVL
jgi:drug/metabolite transporter (DMT)-like permease